MREYTRQQATDEARALEERAKVAQDLMLVNGTPEGERVIGYLLAFSGVFSNSAPLDCNPNVTLFNDGQRSVGNEIISLLGHDSGRFKRRAEFLRNLLAQAERTSLD